MEETEEIVDKLFQKSYILSEMSRNKELSRSTIYRYYKDLCNLYSYFSHQSTDYPYLNYKDIT